MASNEKEVKIKVGTDVDLSKVDSLEKRLNALRNQKIEQRIEINQGKLDEVNSKIASLKSEMQSMASSSTPLNMDYQAITEAQAKLEALEQEKVNLEIAVSDDQLKQAETEIEQLDGKEINLNLAMTNFSQGIQIAKQGLSELKSNMDEVAQAGMQSEQNKAFLEMNLGAEKARDTYQQISDIVASMPGDDNTMRSVLSTAQALGNNLKPQEMKDATATMADYMSASATMGKMATESQQDIMKYLLDGNTAELERGSIVSSQVDKLKEADTFMERQQAMQQVLNDLGYGGLSQQDTMLNKQAEWEGMLYNSQDALSSMWLGAEKGAMDYILQLNDATDGLVGMGIVATQMVGGPLIDVATGIGQVATGMKALKDVGIVDTLSKWGSSFVELGKATLTAGYNALKTAGMFVIEKAQVVASAIAKGMATVASWGLAIAEMAVASPILIIVALILILIGVLIYLYNTNEDVRNAINNFGQTLVEVGQMIWDAMVNAVNQVINALQGLWNYIVTMGGFLPQQVSLTGNSIIDSIIGFMVFIATLPVQLGVIFVNIIAKLLGFGDNFVQRMFQTAMNSVSRFMSQISQLPGKLWNELQQMLSAVGRWASTLPQKFWEAGVNAVKSFLSALGIASPGTMQRMLVWEISEMGERVPEESQKLLRNIDTLGTDVVDQFGNPQLSMDYSLNSQLANNQNGGISGAIRDLIINVGTVDNEERINEIVDAVTKALAFDNETAGRTL